MARKTFNLNKHDNMSLSYENLIQVCVERDNNWAEGKTMWIFKDDSGLLQSEGNNWEVFPNYGRHPEHEQL
jgi:hypothetical protein